MYNGFILASTFDYSPDFCGTERKFIPKPLKDVGEEKIKKIENVLEWFRSHMRKVTIQRKDQFYPLRREHTSPGAWYKPLSDYSFQSNLTSMQSLKATDKSTEILDSIHLKEKKPSFI